MSIIYAKQDGTIIWSDNNEVHKAGRVPVGEVLEVLSESGSWFNIKRPANLSLPENPSYPHYWVRAEDVSFLPIPDGYEEPPVVTPGTEVTSEQVAEALIVVLTWFKQL